jgi:O-antigen ligase
VLFFFSSSGVNDLMRLYAGISFFFAAGMVLYKQEAFDRFSHYFLIVMVIPLLLAFAQRAGLLPYDYLDWLGGGIVVGRASGTYQHPLVLIYFLIYAVPLSLYLLSQPNIRRFYWLALWGFIGISLIAVLFTYHRVGLMAICLQIWVWFILNKRYRFALMLAAMGSLVVFWRWDDLRILYRNIFDILSGEVTLFSSQFLRGRGSLWFLFLESFVDASPFNWLIGHGNAIAEGFVPGYGYVISVEPHNDFIRLLHTYGLIGLGLYFIILGSFLWNSLKLRRSPSFFSRQIGNIMITVLLGVVMLSITTEPMRYPSPIWYLFALGSIVVVLSRKEHVLI